VEPEFEEERRRRMYNMLRHSKAYKKRQVARANEAWNESPLEALRPLCAEPSKGGLFELDQLEQALEELRGARRVTFDERVAVIGAARSVERVVELNDVDVGADAFEESAPSSPRSVLELEMDPEVPLNGRLIAAAKRSPNLPAPRRRPWASPPLGDALSRLLAGLGLLKHK